MLLGYDITAADNVVKSLKLSNHDAAQLRHFCDSNLKIDPSVREHDLRAAVYYNNIDSVRSRLLIASAHMDAIAEDLKDVYEFATKIRLPDFPVRGQDLINRGIKPGKAFGDILKQLETWWVAQDFKPGRTEALKKLDALIS